MACDKCAKSSAEKAATQAAQAAEPSNYWSVYNVEYWSAYTTSRENDRCEHQTTHQRLTEKGSRR